MPQRTYTGPLAGAVDVHVPGSGALTFPPGEAVEVTADQAEALDASGDFKSPAAKSKKPADPSEED